MKFIVGEYHPVLAGSSKVVRDIMESIGLKVDYQAMDNATWRATRADSSRLGELGRAHHRERRLLPPVPRGDRPPNRPFFNVWLER